MARKIHAQEECLFCDAYPCACGKPPAPPAPEPAPIPTAPAPTAPVPASAPPRTLTAPPARQMVTVHAPALAAPPSAPEPVVAIDGEVSVDKVERDLLPWTGTTDEIINRLQVVFPGSKVDRP